MSGNFSDSDIADFKIEASELLDLAEDSLLQLDRGGEFKKNYDAVFRVFHSLKGGSGMLGIDDLQSHMHKLESRLAETKNRNTVTKGEISLFLRGVDASRKMLAGERVDFDHTVVEEISETAKQSPPTAAPNATPAGQPTPSPPGPKPSSRPAKDASAPGEPPVIYLIDDEPEIVSALTEMLEACGMVPRGFALAEELFGAVRDRRPDVVISDYQMPGNSGLDVLREVKRIDADLPVIFISGFLSKEVLMESIRYGIFATIEKPFRENDVVLQCLNAAKQCRLYRSLNRTISLLAYQFPELDDFLRAQGRDEVRENLVSEIEDLIACRRSIRQLLAEKIT